MVIIRDQDMIEIAARIKQKREERGYSYQALANKTNMSKSTLQRYEAGFIKNIPLSKLSILAKALGVTEEWLMGWKEPSTNLIDNFISIPIIGTVKAGINGIAEMDFQGYEQVPDLKNPEEYRAFLIKGDSMEPRITEGDIAVVHIQQSAESGDLVVAIVDGEEGTLKKFVKHENAIGLMSFNQMYPVRIFTGEQMNDVYIWGKVVKIIQNY